MKYAALPLSLALILSACGIQLSTRTPTPASTPMLEAAATTAYTIYADSTSWENWSWDTNLVTLDCVCPQSGSRAIQANFKAWGALSLRLNGTALNTSEYGGVKFGVYGVKGNTRIKVTAYRDDSTIVGSTVVTVTTGQWKDFTLTWAQLGNPAQIKRLAFQNDSATNDSEILVDNLHLTAGSSVPPPTGTTCSSVSGIDPSAVYTLTAKHSGKALDVEGVSLSDGARIQQWAYGGGDNQKWTLSSVGEGFYKITSLKSGKAIDVEGGTTATQDGVAIHQWGYGGWDNQKWCLSDVGGGFVKIIAKHSGKALAINANLTSDGAKAIQWPYLAANDNFKFKLEKVSTTTPPPASGDSIANTLELIDTDSDPTLSHEAIPSGVPDSPAFWWKYHAAFQDTTRNSGRPGINDCCGRGYIDEMPAFNTINPWGEVYVAQDGNPAWNTRVQIKDIQLYVLSKATNTWVQLAFDRYIGGGPYSENFDNGSSGGVCQDRSVSRWFRDEPDGTRSVTAGSGCQAHFWLGDSRRVDWNAADAKGLYATFKARLILNDPGGPDDRDSARYIAGVGIDYFKKNYVMQGPTDFSGNSTLGQGRFVVLKKQWRNVNVSDLTLTQLRQNPPPINN